MKRPISETSSRSLDLDLLLSAAVADGRVPGVVAIASDRSGLLYEGAFGVTEPIGRQLEPSSIFRLASMTKLVTAVAVMQLVDEGRLSLDAPVGAILPEFDQLPVLEWTNERPHLRP